MHILLTQSGKIEKRSTKLKEKILKRSTKLKEILFDFNPKEIKEKYGNENGLESLIVVFNEKLSLNPKIKLRKKNSQWMMFGKGAISAAILLSGFKSKDEFGVFIKDFQRKNSLEALPMLLAEKIFGFGFALACDFLKEAGYDVYPKPDVHLMDVFEVSGLCVRNYYEVFKTIMEVAGTVGKTPYEVDKRIWLVCSGNFYYDYDKPVADKKAELLEQLSR